MAEQASDAGPRRFDTALTLRAFIDGGYPATLRQSAALVYMNLLRRANLKGLCNPGQKRISREMGISLRSVQTGIERLEGAGLIEVTDEGGQKRTAKERKWTGNANRYRLLPIHQGNAPGALPNAGEAAQYRKNEPQGNAPPASQVIKEESNKRKALAPPARSFSFLPGQIDAMRIWANLMEYIRNNGTLKGIPVGAKLLRRALQGFGGFDCLAAYVKGGASAKDLGFSYRQFEAFFRGAVSEGLEDDQETPAPATGTERPSAEPAKDAKTAEECQVSQSAVNEVGQETMAPVGMAGDNRGELLI